MKRLILVLAVLVLAVSVQAATLRFDASENADGYIVYYGTESGAYPFSKDLGNITEQDNIESFLNLTPGTWYFIVRAYNTMGESGDSNMAEWSISEYVVTDNPKPVTIVIPGPVTITIGD